MSSSGVSTSADGGPVRVHHLNCGILHAPPNPPAACHCVLIERNGRLALFDTGIGLEDVARPLERLGEAAIRAAGFQFHEHLTAVRQIERLGFQPADVADIVLTHGDPDHAGGLSDFPAAAVHVSVEEHARLEAGHSRYSAAQFAHGPRWVVQPESTARWLGMEGRPIPLALGIEVILVPLFGHTLGHCGVAVPVGDRWLLFVGDAYYLRAELASDDHPVSALAALRADDDRQRRSSLSELRRLHRDHGAAVDLFGYHDFAEFPPESSAALQPAPFHSDGGSN